MANVLANLLMYVLLGFIFYRIFRRPKERAIESAVTFRNQQYDFVVGNNISSYPAYGMFNGLDMALPIDMPHIYLDSLKSGGLSVEAIFDSSQRLALEGDFGQYFAVFVPVAYKDLALSVLTPDVMEVLERYASQFDVELYGTHLRIISNRTVINNAARQTELLEVAEKITKELEERVRSWTASNDIQSFDADLIVYPRRGIRIFGRYMTWIRFWLSIFWLMCVLEFIAGGVWLALLHHYPEAAWMIGGGLVLFIGLQVFTKISQAKTRFRSRQS